MTMRNVQMDGREPLAPSVFPRLWHLITTEEDVFFVLLIVSRRGLRKTLLQFNLQLLKLFSVASVGTDQPRERKMKSGLLPQYGLSSAYVFDSVQLGALNSSGHVNFYSRKVFLGGLPPDIDEHEIKAVFWKFGSFEVYWPGKDNNPQYMFPPKGFAFLLFLAEDSVRRLVQACIHGNDGGLYYLLSSPSVKNKVIQVKPWKLSDAVTIVHESLFTKKQFAVFVGGVPRALTSGELARQALCVFGNVSYSEIFLDYKIGYPKGSGVIYFSNFKSFVSAIRTKFFEVVVDDSVKYVELKPYFRKW